MLRATTLTQVDPANQNDTGDLQSILDSADTSGLEVGGEDFYLDLLFFHLRLRCFVVIDLKMGDFKPEYAGKMGFYLTAVDEQRRHASDQATIGMVLCKAKNKVIVEYTLRDVKKPMGVSA